MLDFSKKASQSSDNHTLGFSQRYQFWLLFIFAIIVLQIPLVSIPFKWLESYFHEISHGLTAIITGGTIVQIQLFPNGAGLCTTRGGSSFLISFMGYGGAIIWGGLLFSLASVHRNVARVFSIILLCLLSSSILLWVRDILTLFIVLVLILLVAAQVRFSSHKSLQKMLQVTGLLVLINSLMSPLYLLDGQARGDGAALADITLIPEIVWVSIWFISAVFVTYRLSKTKF
ncbi:M50 family metallopeptidase [Cognaticolwellia mytili]|uniref:M50 family metallopeptidase n=1 Tax=Cognaticolwellia mytili TaxID=1888913 RepID=UPI001F37AC43|nr:M50 family metallopeptidase [Cognaticolwellia mytili]